MPEFTPPMPLSIHARRTWDRLAQRIHGEGRWNYVDHDLLCIFCQTLEYYERSKEQVDTHGILVRGSRNKDMVRNPALTPMGQFRADLIRLSRVIPIVNPKPDQAGIEVDQFLESVFSE